MKGITIGFDLAKNVFEVYVEDETGQMVERRRLSRNKMLPWCANRPRAVVALANKNARVAFALMHRDQPYDVTKMCGAA